jgi:hypothetical protein
LRAYRWPYAGYYDSLCLLKLLDDTRGAITLEASGIE